MEELLFFADEPDDFLTVGLDEDVLVDFLTVVFGGDERVDFFSADDFFVAAELEDLGGDAEDFVTES